MRLTFLIAVTLLLLPEPAVAEPDVSPFRWNLQQEEVIKYETVIKTSSKIPLPQEEAPGGRPKEQLQNDFKEYFGENYKKGYLSNQSTQNTITILKKSSENRINLTTVILNESSTAKQDFVKKGLSLKKGLVTDNYYMNNEGKLIPSNDNKQQEPTQITSNQQSLLQNILFYLPEKIKKPGDTEILDIPCTSVNGFPIVKHKKKGAISFHKIEKDKDKHEIAVLTYSFYERLDFLDTPEPDYSKTRTTACRYKGSGRFNLTTGRWELIYGKLKTIMRQDTAIEMDKQDIMNITSSSTIQIKPTDKSPPKQITYEEYGRALKAEISNWDEMDIPPITFTPVQ